MEKQSNTGWYLLGIIALVALAGAYRKEGVSLSTKKDTAPDTAGNQPIILATVKT